MLGVINALLDTNYPSVYAGMTCRKGEAEKGAVESISDQVARCVGVRFPGFFVGSFADFWGSGAR